MEMYERLDGVKEQEEFSAAWGRRLIFIYLLLLLVEGALRKWIFPGLSNVLLVIRDPVVLAIYALLGRNCFANSRFMQVWLMGLAGVSALAAVTLLTDASVSAMTLVYGIRTYFLHLPLIVILYASLRREDLERIKSAAYILCGLSSALMFFQFSESGQHWINNGAGGAVGVQIASSMGKIRPAGFFSFVTGIQCFYPLMLAFVLADFHSAKDRAVVLALKIAAAGSGILVSGSRFTVVLSALVLASYVLSCAVLRSHASRRFHVKHAVFAGGVFAALLAAVPGLAEGFEVLVQRFTDASRVEFMGERILSEILNPVRATFTAPFLGHGVGIGTNVGAALQGSQSNFQYGESDWLRTILELGPLGGWLFIGLRCAVGLWLLRFSLECLRHGGVLPLLLTVAQLPNLLLGPFGQATALGFAVSAAGITAAILRWELSRLSPDSIRDGRI